jgi:prevent-host-death family protein
MERTMETSPHVPVAQLKARLSEYLRIARSGGEVVVTERGTPIARLVPVGPALAGEGRLARLAQAGLVREARRPFTPELLEGGGPRDPAGRLLEIVLEERAADR